LRLAKWGSAMILHGSNFQPIKVSKWVISVVSKRGTDVGFSPNSDRESYMPYGR